MRRVQIILDKKSRVEQHMRNIIQKKYVIFNIAERSILTLVSRLQPINISSSINIG